MTPDKLKVAARQHEQREEWRAAIEFYRQAIRESEGGTEGGDPSLYNRIGDLEQKAGDGPAACEAWEQAAGRYAEQGLFNNAIGLCGKILRLDPSRVRTYLDLARYQARKRVLFDVRQNLKFYLDRMVAGGRGEQAREQIDALGAEFPAWRELRQLINELLGREEESDADSAAGGGADGGRGLVFLDTEPIRIERASDPASPEAALVIEPTAVNDLAVEGGAGLLSGFEPTVPGGDVAPSEADAPTMDGLVDVERTSAEVGAQAPMDGLDLTLDASGSAPIEATPVEGLDRPEVAAADDAIALDGFESASFEAPVAEPVAPPPATDDALVFLDTDTSAAPAAPAVPEPAPDDPVGQRVAAHALLEHGDRAGGIRALELAFRLHQEREEWLHAWQVATELVQAEPAAIARHQARVELAATRMQEPAKLCEAYADLGDALVREGSGEKAIAVFRRILEIDERHERARAALRAMAPDGPASDVPEGFVDFGAMVIDDAGPRTTRMRTETTAISANEDETFREALNEFKRALDQNLPVEDHQAHYDLGIAFREMGLLDEAISEFQKALRSPVARLRTSEALGQSFFEQGRPAVAEAVLRSVERGPEGDADKIGVLYWLGRALEAQGKGNDARGCYERVLAVDVGFMDVVARLGALA